MKIYNYIALAGCLTLVSCSSGADEPATGAEEKPLLSQIGISRASSDGAFQFQNNDAVGLYMINYSATQPGAITNGGDLQIDNKQLIYGQSATTPPAGASGDIFTEFYWKNSQTNADFVAYYPYYAGITNPESYLFTLSETSLHDSDFLWGAAENVKPTATPVGIQLQHLMCMIDIKIEYGKGFDQSKEAVTNVWLCQAPKKATINLRTGVATSDMTDLAALYPAQKKTDVNYQAIVSPHSRAAAGGANLIKVETAKDAFYLKNNPNMVFESGKKYTATLTLEKTAGGIDIGIGNWEVVDGDFGGTVN